MTTSQTAAARRVTYQLETLNFGYFALRRSMPHMEPAKRSTSRTSPSGHATTCTRATSGRASSR